jgi:hypothetical protein
MPISSSLYVKNLPGWERALRLAMSVAMIALALTVLPRWWSWVTTAGAAMLALTAFVGFCPMCALVGRRLAQP